MNVFYDFQGTTYEVSPDKLEQFLKDKPGAVQITPPGKVKGSTGDPTGSQSTTGSGLASGSSGLLGKKKKEIADILKKHEGSFWAEARV